MFESKKRDCGVRQFYVVSLAEFILRLEFAKVATLATTTISYIILYKIKSWNLTCNFKLLDEVTIF
jgi:hypothetical protein